LREDSIGGQPVLWPLQEALVMHMSVIWCRMWLEGKLLISMPYNYTKGGGEGNICHASVLNALMCIRGTSSSDSESDNFQHSAAHSLHI